MMHTKVLSNFYWAEAIKTIVYILNKSHTRSLDNIAPYECCLGNNPCVKYFKVFGCVAYVHVSDEHRKKFDAKSERCIFICYSEHSKSYRFFNPISHKVVVSRDAIFDKGGCWKSQKYQK